MAVRSYCFTINNYTDEDLSDVVELGTLSQYIIAGFEIGENGTPHIQGYVYIPNKMSIKQISLVLKRAHIEQAKGNVKQNEDYCKKDGDFYEEGIIPQQGKCSWEKVEEVMKNPRENFHLYVQYNKAYKQLKLQEYVDKVKEHIIYKITPAQEDLVYETYSSDDLLVVEGFDTYRSWTGQRVVYYAGTNIGDASIIKRWAKGHPPTILRGYETLKYDPEIIILSDGFQIGGIEDLIEYNNPFMTDDMKIISGVSI